MTLIETNTEQSCCFMGLVLSATQIRVLCDAQVLKRDTLACPRQVRIVQATRGVRIISCLCTLEAPFIQRRCHIHTRRFISLLDVIICDVYYPDSP